MKKQLDPQPLLFPMPALLVGTYGEDGTPDAMTAAWTGVCCFKPVCMGVAIRDTRLTFANLIKKKAFTLNVPSASQATEVDYLGIVSGKKEPNKVAIAGLETAKGVEVDAPLITPCPVNIECALTAQVALGTHTWFVGEVLKIHVDEPLVQENGILDIAAMDPLTFITSTGEYHKVGAPIGKAYSIGKTLKKES